MRRTSAVPPPAETGPDVGPNKSLAAHDYLLLATSVSEIEIYNF